MKLTPRLQCIADKLNMNSAIADIGTDHGYIPIYAVKKGICNRAIAVDIRKGPLARARRNIIKYGLEDKIELRQGSGLSPINNGEVNCAILAGMGGYLICDILEDDKDKANTIECFIIQPMQLPEIVRKYLYKSNYSILSEQLIKENGKIYEVMKVIHGKDRLDDEIYFEIGKNLISNKDSLLKEFIEGKIEETHKIINKIGNAETSNGILRLDECRNKLIKYKEVLGCL